MANFSKRPYFCKYYGTWFMPNPYNGNVDDAELCKNKDDNLRNVCLQCAQYLNPSKIR